MGRILLMLYLFISVQTLASEMPTKEDCQRDLQQALDSEILLSMRVDEEAIQVVPDPSVWAQSSYETKLMMGAVIECAVAGPGKYVALILFRDSRTNKVVGRYKLKKLTVD